MNQLDIITIDKSKIPYEFQYEVNGIVWTLGIDIVKRGKRPNEEFSPDKLHQSLVS